MLAYIGEEEEVLPTGVFLPRSVIEKGLGEVSIRTGDANSEKNKLYALQIMAEEMSENHFKLPETAGSINCRVNAKFFNSLRTIRDREKTCALSATIGPGIEHTLHYDNKCSPGSFITTVNTGPDKFHANDRSSIVFLPPITENGRSVIVLPTTETISRNILNVVNPYEKKVDLTVLNMRVASDATVELNAIMKATQIAMTEITYDCKRECLTDCYTAVCDFFIFLYMNKFINQYQVQEGTGRTNKLWFAILKDMHRSPDPLLFLRRFFGVVLPEWYAAIIEGPAPLSPPLNTLTAEYYALFNILARVQAFLKPARSGAIGQEVASIIDPNNCKVDGQMRNWAQYMATGLLTDDLSVAREVGRIMGHTYRSSMGSMFHVLDLFGKLDIHFFKENPVGHISHASEQHTTVKGDRICVVLG